MPFVIHPWLCWTFLCHQCWKERRHSRRHALAVAAARVHAELTQ